MRTLNSAKNLITSIGITLVMTFLGFFTRKIFVDSVGVEYIGLNGFLTNILGVMSLLEGGFATSVIYNMYKPIAAEDHPKIIALLQLYKKVYRWIALGIFILSLLIYPFLHIFIKDVTSLSYLSIVYFIFVFNTLVGYFTAHKWAMINASQKAYKLAFINLTYQVGLSLAKILILYYTKDYILYLIIEAIFGIGQNIAVVQKCNKMFPYITTRKKYPIEKAVKDDIIKKMKALFLSSLGGYFMTSTDNIIISSFLGVSIIGYYSNYTLIVGLLRSFSDRVLTSYSESVGNLIASENEKEIYKVFRVAFFLDFIIASLLVIILWNTLDYFITWWLGKDYVLDQYIKAAILLNAYIMTMRGSAFIFKQKAGIFMQDRFTPLLQGTINVALSIIFVQYWGLAGVIFATIISLLSIGFWQFPRLCYKYIFHLSVARYFHVYIIYTLAMLSALTISHIICNYISINDLFIQSIVNGMISFITFIIIVFFFFYYTYPFQQLLKYINILFSKAK